MFAPDSQQPAIGSMDPLLDTALNAADAATRIHLRDFRRVGVEDADEKGKSDFVSRVDLESQAAAIEVIRNAFPDHHILAEEGKESLNRSWPAPDEFLWIIDPLDGTTNFLHGHPMFGASVAVGRAGELEAGAVVAGVTGERWWGRRGGGAWKNGDRITVSDTPGLSKALVGTGFPFKEPEIIPRFLGQLGRVLPASGGVRRGGSAALDLCYLAEGILDGFWEEDYLSPWDVAAGLLILQEAGGVASRMDGSDIGLTNGSVLAANSQRLKDELDERLREK
jgi:myo-inositol-1(or 4)-monophosphatase